MFSIKNVQAELEAGASLKTVAEAFTDIASIKLKRIRSDIERNRRFVAEIAKVYWLVKTEAIKRKVVFSLHKKDTVSILITSNLRFYGSINSDLIQNFILSTSKYKTERVVIGLQGKKYLEDIEYPNPFKSFVFRQDLPDSKDLSDLLAEISVYKQILVFYPQMQSVLVQTPTIKDLTQVSSTQQEVNSTKEKLDYIFEPEVEKMIKFFEGQIIITLLEQTFLEGELSRTAARLISMDMAQINADKFMKEKQKELREISRNYTNFRILDSINNLFSLKK